MPFYLTAHELGDSRERGAALILLQHITERIRKHLSEDSPYSGLLNFLMTDVFEVPTEEEIRMLESKRESADLDEMPYPILFGMDGTARSDSDLPVYKACNGMEV